MSECFFTFSHLFPLQRLSSGRCWCLPIAQVPHIWSDLVAQGEDSRHVGIEYKQASLAAPDAGDFANLHGNRPLGPQNRLVKLLLGPAYHLVCCHVVVTPDNIRVDRNDNNNEATLLLSYM